MREFDYEAVKHWTLIDPMDSFGGYNYTIYEEYLAIFNKAKELIALQEELQDVTYQLDMLDEDEPEELYNALVNQYNTQGKKFDELVDEYFKFVEQYETYQIKSTEHIEYLVDALEDLKDMLDEYTDEISQLKETIKKTNK